MDVHDPREITPRISSRTLGVDLASAATNTAACILDWDLGSPRLVELRARNVDDDTIVQMAATVGVVGIDAPFGWPRPFADAIAAYSAGAPWPRARPDGLWLRQTDLRARDTAGGRPPLSVSSDRIARPAERAARLPTLLGSGDRAANRDGSDDVIEVYPAGALRCWHIGADGYKRPDGIAAREGVVRAITDALDLRLIEDDRLRLSATDHATDALVAAVVARASVATGPPLARPEGFPSVASRGIPARMKHYTIAEVAHEFEVTPATVRRWIRGRKLIGIRPSWAAGAYRIPARALDVFRTQRKRPTR